jgi:hypothetical protein
VTSEDQIILVAIRNAYYAQTRRLAKTPPDYQLRRVFRDYSQRFHTPLHVVETLPLEDVLTHYWEAYYEEATKPEDIMVDILRMVKDPEDLRREQETEDAADADTWRDLMDEKRAAQAIAKLDEVVKRFSAKLPPSGMKVPPKDKDVDLVQKTAAPPPKVVEKISMRFAAPGDIDEDADSFGLMSDPKKK